MYSLIKILNNLTKRDRKFLVYSEEINLFVSQLIDKANQIFNDFKSNYDDIYSNLNFNNYDISISNENFILNDF